ncbi:WhiB family transcriptional regulator [Streptomyces erythrochromogenes]|uniref:WhiB family transcriptional regulator n=1 Tax=Streptomyces erythrochromogenes TaxID=285574 RepID=UPI0036BA6FFA
MQFLRGRERVLLALIESPDPSDFARAECRDADVDLYHPSDRQKPDADVLASCCRCAVRLQCLALALRAEDPETRSGWYGGFGPEDRDAIASSLSSTGGGQPPPSPEHVIRARRLVGDGWRINEVADLLGCSRRTVQRYLHSVG